MKHTSETHENIRSSMPWSDGKIWVNTQLPTINRHGSSKRHMQIWARAPLTNRKAAWPALQLANLVGQNSNATGSMRQGQLGLGVDNTQRKIAGQ
jgi:hypothetical protein